PGVLRLFTGAFGTQVSWLLPAALVLLVAAIWLTRRTPRTDTTRAGLLLWGGWTVVTAATFSFMSGIIHPYYTIALAPGIAALVGIGGAVLLRHRGTWLARIVLAAVTAGTAVWAFVMLGWSAAFLPWLRWPVLVIGVLAAIGFLVPSGRRRWAATVVGAAVLAGVSAPAAYAVQTAMTAHTGSIPTAGPTVAGADSGPGGMPGGRPGRTGQEADEQAVNGQAGQLPSSTATGDTATGGAATGGAATGGAAPDGAAPGGAAPGGAAPGGAAPGGAAPGGGAGGGMGGGMGGPGGGGEATSAELVALLQQAGSRWAAATIGSQGAASMQLASGDGVAVMAIGGFSGSDTYPTLEQFQAYVRDGQIRYFVNGGGGGGPGGNRGVGAQIAQWVTEHYTPTTVGGSTVYDLSSPAR
ncbi:MAG: glycosyl transferase, partial [Pseudonocardia sp.]|nr:glycosyl transferase [Pseudonocardia sp.]